MRLAWRGSRSRSGGGWRKHQQSRQGFAAALAVLLLPGLSAAQQTDCNLEEVGGYTHSRRFDSLNYIHRASGGIDYRCSDGTRILADSAVVYEHSDLVQLFGDVHFEDPDTELEADSARYFGNIRQLQAWSRVTVTDRRSEAVIQGDSLRFDRESPFRTMDRILVYGGDPHATVYPVARPAPPEPEADPAADSTVAAADSVPDAPLDATLADTVSSQTIVVAEPVPVPLPPYDIDAERFMIDGRRFFRAGGDVVVLRDSLRALGDSLDYDQEVGTMSVLGNASVSDRGFEMVAATVSVTPTIGLNEEILAREHAELVGSDVEMTAPAIRMFLNDGAVNRLVAVSTIPPLPGDTGDSRQEIDTKGLSPGDAERVRALAAEKSAAAALADSLVADSLSRPTALADDFSLTGDSIDVLSPGQLLETVTAVGSARAEAAGQDSIDTADLPDIATRDWMDGQTIVAAFTPPEVRDSTAAAPEPRGRRARLETLTAIGEARSLYRLTASDTTRAEPDGPPALHLVQGQQITIYLEEREVVKMEVEGQTVGYHLEPLPPESAADSAAVLPDSTLVRPDTLSIPPDSTSVRPDTTSIARVVIRPRTKERK